MSTYVFDTEWELERERLAGLERIFDPGTREVLAGVGVEPGWRCLEVGAGGGSIAEWLCEQVGPGGAVVATDTDPKFLAAIDQPNLVVRQHDIRGDESLGDGFDLVHARLLVAHVGVGVLPALAAAARPGGVVVVEDLDFATAVGWPGDDAFDKVGRAIVDLGAVVGVDPLLGRKLVHELRAAGLADVGARGRVTVAQGGTPDTAGLTLTLTTLRGALTSAGLLTENEVDRSLECLADPAFTSLAPMIVSAWGYAS